MSAITLKTVPNDLHRKIKIMQMDYEDEGVKKTLEEIYIELLEKGIKSLGKKEKAAK